MNEIRRVEEWIQRGKQVGKSFAFVRDGESVWSSVAIQKWRGAYKVYIDEIRESQMASENYDKEVLVTFSTLREAASFVAENSKTEFVKLRPCKGQTLFNPSFGD